MLLSLLLSLSLGVKVRLCGDLLGSERDNYQVLQGKMDLLNDPRRKEKILGLQAILREMLLEEPFEGPNPRKAGLFKAAGAHGSSPFVKWKFYFLSLSPAVVLVLLVSPCQQTKRKYRGQIEIITSYKACQDLFLKNNTDLTHFASSRENSGNGVHLFRKL